MFISVPWGEREREGKRGGGGGVRGSGRGWGSEQGPFMYFFVGKKFYPYKTLKKHLTTIRHAVHHPTIYTPTLRITLLLKLHVVYGVLPLK